MNVLVTGANGFVGKAVCNALVRGGHAVRKAVRAGVAPAGDAVVVGEIDEQTDWVAALASVEVVIHLAARVRVMHDFSADPLAEFRRVNVAGTEHLARAAAAAGVRRLVFVSSIKVNGEQTEPGRKFTELDEPAPQDPYGMSKHQAEEALHRVARETGVEVVIVRPPLVYGPGVKGNFIQMLKMIGKGAPLPLASAANLRSLVYVENLADALITCATHPAAAGQTYLVSDGEDISTPDLLRALAAGAGRPCRLFPFPPGLLKALSKLAGKGAQADRLLGSLRVESGKIRRELDWVPPYTSQQGLRATADWYRTEKSI